MTISYKRDRHCAECGVKVSDQSKTGRCLQCNLARMNSDPEMCRRRGETLRRHCQTDPLFRARRASTVIRNKNAGMADPVKRARMVATWRENLAKAWTPEALAKKAAMEPIAARKLAEKRMAWCPEEYRDLYRYLVKSKKMTMAEAKEIVAEQIKTDLANLSPFERQERALAKGAQLVANDEKPSLAYPGVYRPGDAA